MLVVDDHDLVRLGLRTLVQSHAAASGRAVQVFEARTLQEALALYGDQQAAIGLVLLDLHLPDAHGLSGLSTFIAHFPAASVVVLSGVSDPALMREAMARGASAYLAKSGDLQQVVSYIRSQGLLNPSAGLSGGASEPQAPPADDTEPVGLRVVRTALGESLQLTARQAQVLDWILAGQSNRQIADQAHLSEGTVKNHVSTLLLLFGVRSRAQLISQLR
ncbi:response regulator transcription factor [Rhodoferax sp. UBA5149]|uniref:response regulator transcription factor n=1 Tax=Rhodoferax sp. UBA5149 TaxID=1947379 RepID=UPI0025DD148A|nr:response regulator transcription factor [Rhodoferax sp. UBA5149]